MIWVLTVKIGMCMGIWCDLFRARFETYEQCLEARDTIMRDAVPSDTVRVAVCGLEKDKEQRQ